ncbi:MAG: hypothetical protein DSM107014_03150 [Gomphosphaeria aponina SAG 52.96 = DSM 107014]|uniref:Uncharacterized protein n=1 Tax=Gomphosphaeria aponina SAG 52.96 = DSM 107014 TaxID=1521640 RepID=A0A941GNY3_9CHRO|nr:hypothetical protein [Gomphosphaeria aponina SAG 52.96 = DSM 107014]
MFSNIQQFVIVGLVLGLMAISVYLNIENGYLQKIIDYLLTKFKVQFYCVCIFLSIIIISFLAYMLSFVEWDSWKNIFEVIRTLTPVGTMYIGYLAYSTFIKNKLSEKQLDLVIEIIQLFTTSQEDSFYLTLKDGGYNHILGKMTDLSVTIKGFLQKKEKSNDFTLTNNDRLHICITFHEQVLEKLKHHRVNPLLPKEIAKSIKKIFDTSLWYFRHDDTIKQYNEYHLSVNEYNYDLNKNFSKEQFIKNPNLLNREGLPLLKFLELLIEIEKTSIAWCKKHGFKDLNE